MAESATLAVSAAAARMKAQGADIISFGAGEPDFNTPANIRNAAAQALNDGKTKYPKPASGIPEAKQAVLHKLKTENDLEYAPEQVIVTAGGKMTIALTIHA
ncbi:MAG: aminotransferase class I/II-fold pyridoxal phosphate-dependent enzyme, partial [Phycisphaerae bacterium]